MALIKPVIAFCLTIRRSPPRDRVFAGNPSKSDFPYPHFRRVKAQTIAHVPKCQLFTIETVIVWHITAMCTVTVLSDLHLPGYTVIRDSCSIFAFRRSNDKVELSRAWVIGSFRCSNGNNQSPGSPADAHGSASKGAAFVSRTEPVVFVKFR